jgi:hypothetical protein
MSARLRAVVRSDTVAKIAILANGIVCCEANLGEDWETLAVSIGADTVAGHGLVLIGFKTDQVSRPIEIGRGADPRLLGISVEQVQFSLQAMAEPHHIDPVPGSAYVLADGLPAGPD